MAKKFKKTKLATAISIAAVSLGLSATADAVVVVGGDNGWEVSFDGNINAFYTLTDYDAGFTTLGYVTPGAGGFGQGNTAATTAVPELDSARVTSGYLPAFFSFNVKSPTVNGLTATGRISFAPVIQNANAKNQFYPSALGGSNGGVQGLQGSGIDTREVVVNVEGDFGTFSFGRTLSIFGRQAMLKDQTLFGVGAPNKQNGSISAGRTGRGYTYPNFNARFSYKTPNINGLQAEFGLYDPSVEQNPFNTSNGTLLNETDTPRFEGELSYTTTFSTGSFQLWMDGMWQDIESNAPGAAGDVTVAAVGFGADAKMNGFNVLGYYYTGQGLGRSLQFVGGTRCEASGKNCQEADNDGYYVQGSYTFNGKTKVATSYGQSSEDGFAAIGSDGLNTFAMAATQDVELNMWTIGVYHDMTSWMKMVAEYSNLENEYKSTSTFSSGKTEADVFSLGAFLFW
jgi:hypothetical protein